MIMFMKICMGIENHCNNNQFYRQLCRRSVSHLHAENLKKLIGNANCIDPVTDYDRALPYIMDWTSNYKGGGMVCLPGNTSEVSAVIKYCSNHSIGVVPQGGNTGLCGGSVGNSLNEEIIISLKRMNHIIRIDEDACAMVAEAGCILEVLNGAAMERDLMVPLDLGAKGSCTIGGNVATNAGGLRVLRYGSLFKNVLGLEVVLANGDVVDMLRTLHKDNTGYHLKNLFIGSEGTLGIVTKVALQLASKPVSTNVALIKIPSFKDVTKILGRARKELGDILSAFEFMDSNSINTLKMISPTLFGRFEESLFPATIENNERVNHRDEEVQEEGRGILGDILLLIECQGSDSSTRQRERLDEFLSKLFHDDIIGDGTVSSDLSHEQRCWAIRESVPVALMQASRRSRHGQANRGKLFKYDVSLHLNLMDKLVFEVQGIMLHHGYRIQNCQPFNVPNPASGYELVVCTFGHAGDQNLHLNILLTEDNSITSKSEGQELDQNIIKQVQTHLNDAVYSTVLKHRGSCSAEHGIGVQKTYLLEKARNAIELDLMIRLKKTIDPHNILNPGKVIPIARLA